jgi:hypothetical protein
LYASGFYDTSFPAFFHGYGNSFSVDGAGYGYNESKAMPGAFGAGQAPEATPPETPSGASVVPKGIASEAANYEVRLAELSTPRTVTSGSRPLPSGYENLPTMPTMPTVTTPAAGALGFTKSDSAPEKPTTRAFASLVTSGMSAPVGAMAETGQAGGLFGGLLSFGAPGDWLDRNFGGGAYGPPDAFGRAAAGIRTIAAFAPIAGEISDFSEVFSGVGPNGETLSGWERGATFVAAGIPFVPAKIAREAVGAAGKAADDVVSAARPAISAPPLHHIATNKNWISTVSGGPWSPRFEVIFKKAGLSLNDALNKVRIPGHHGPHPGEYHNAIFQRLQSATDRLSGEAYRAALLSELDELAKEAATPGNPLNKMLTE